MKRRSGIWLSLGVFLSLSSAATPIPASFVLNHALKNHEGLKSILVEGKITDLRSSETFRETLKIDFLSGKVSVSYHGGAQDESWGGFDTQLKSVHRLGKFWLGLGLDPNGARFKDALSELNLVPKENEETKLSRIGTQVTWSYGDDSEVDFLKDEFVPVHYRSEKGAGADEVFISDFVPTDLDLKVPKKLMVKLKDKDAYRFELTDFKVNQTVIKGQQSHPVTQATAKEWLMLVR